MDKQQQEVSRQIDENIAALERAGFRKAEDTATFKSKLPTIAGAAVVPVWVEDDSSKETIDFVFDCDTGDIIDWGKAPRTRLKSGVSFKLSVGYGIGDRVKKIVRSFVVDKVSDAVAGVAAREVDQAIKAEEALLRVAPNMALSPLIDTQRQAMDGQRVLLLVHGIFSKTASAFDGLKDIEGKLRMTYGDNIIAYDHFTLCKTTEENAADLVKQLPKGAKIDIVCHSRGAGVVRFMLETAANKQALCAAKIGVGTVCFAAGACLGSPLASKETADSLFKVLTRAMVLGGTPTAPWAVAIGLAARAAVGGVQKFPGVESMDPEGEVIKRLNGTEPSVARSYCYIRANYAPEGWLKRFGDQIVFDKKIFNGGNDLVVPWKGAGPSASYAPNLTDKKALYDFGGDVEEQHEVMHTNFFYQTQVRECLLKELDVDRCALEEQVVA